MKVIHERLFSSDVHVLILDNGEVPLLVAGEYRETMVVTKAENYWMLENGYERVGAVNCGFFNTRNGEILGQCLCDWSNVKMSETGWYDGIADVAYDGSKIVVGDFPTFEGMQWVRAVSWGIIKDGKEWNLGREKYSHSNTKQPRTMIGKTKEGFPILITVDGRGVASKILKGAVSLGVTSKQQLEIAKHYDCRDLVNADGGGSSVMEYKGEIVNNPSDGSLRRCTDFIVVYKKKEEQKYFRVVAKSSQNYEEAKSIVENLKANGIDAFVKKAVVEGRVWYRAYAGSYIKRENAVLQQKVLSSLGYNSFLIYE